MLTMEALTMEETFIVTGLAVLVIGTALGFLAWWIQSKETDRNKEDMEMRQSRARRERLVRRMEYEQRLREWERSKPAWWRIFARRKWRASKPVYDRRG